MVSASALVISGQDGDLGTLVNDVPYSVSSGHMGEPDLPGAAGQQGPVDRPGGVQRLRPEHPGHRPAHRRGDH